MSTHDWTHVKDQLNALDSLLRDYDFPSRSIDILSSIEQHLKAIGMHEVLPEKCAEIKRIARKFYGSLSMKRFAISDAKSLHWRMLAQVQGIKIHINMLEAHQAALPITR